MYRCVVALAVALAVASPAAAAARRTIVFTRGTWSWYEQLLTDGDLYSVRADGTGLRDLTRATRETIEIAARWSPDGRRVAFVRARAGWPVKLHASIWTMNADGSRQRRLTGDVVQSRDSGDSQTCPEPACGAQMAASWSPSGRLLVFARAERWGYPVHLWTMRADGTHKRKLTHAWCVDTQATWSPNGRWIAFRRQLYDEPRAAVYLIHPDGSGLHQLQLPLGEWTEPAPTWSPDSTRLAWSAGNDGLGVTDVRTGVTVIVPGVAGLALEPSWAGSAIAFDTFDAGIALVAADGSGGRPVTTPPDGFRDVFPTLRPS